MAHDSELIIFRTSSPTNPIGVKGLGDSGTIPIAPAIISAIEDPLTPTVAQIAEAPLSPIRIHELIDAGSDHAHVSLALMEPKSPRNPVARLKFYRCAPQKLHQLPAQAGRQLFSSGAITRARAALRT